MYVATKSLLNECCVSNIIHKASSQWLTATSMVLTIKEGQLL